MAPPSKSIDPKSDTPSQADTPMTDANEEAVTSVPVDNADAQMTVSVCRDDQCISVAFVLGGARAKARLSGPNRGRSRVLVLLPMLGLSSDVAIVSLVWRLISWCGG